MVPFESYSFKLRSVRCPIIQMLLFAINQHATEKLRNETVEPAATDCPIRSYIGEPTDLMNIPPNIITWLQNLVVNI